ncbi:unnamed protein product [Urochloa decumbens]|uniref:Protein kinase domain-containing protein n=1 Tax=Urochloa decumbens TaxID=240449 RepID=A0ABC9AFT2_9POAL
MAMELLTLGLLASLLLHAAGAIDNNNISCAPVRCGNLSITYPFSLTGVQPPYCGYPALELACDAAGRAYLSRASRQHVYRVGDISYDNNSMVVAVEAAFAGDAACHVPDFNVSSALSLLPLDISGANRNLVFVYNCAVPPSVRLPRPCANRTMGAYITGRNENWGVPTNCSAVSLPVRGFHEGMELPAKDRYEGLISDGYLLEWTAVGDCAACKRKGGECRFVQLSFQCFCHDELLCTTTPQEIGSTARKIIIGFMLAATFLIFACAASAYTLIWYGKDNKLRVLSSNSMERNIEHLITLHGSLTPRSYEFSEVIRITSSFCNKLGQGGYGTVFSGRLDDGRLVAVKLLHISKGRGEDFVNEVMSISKTSHVNIVSLLGFCLEGSKRALIYEYMPNGSLDKYIYSEKPKEILGWEKLYKIAIGIARGLEYLHHSCNTRIVHFDIKPQNILLDKDFCPKIADFGLAKLSHSKESKLSVTCARGTIGFIAPEVLYPTFGVVSTKSDVYGYGMMLLEMTGGQKNVKTIVEKSSEKYFTDWIYDHFAKGDGLQTSEITSEFEEMAKRMALIGLWCIQVLPVHRPTITNVLDMFDRRLDELEMPPKQNFGQIIEDCSTNLSAESAQVLSECFKLG